MLAAGSLKGEKHMVAAETERNVYDIGEIEIDGLEPTPEMKEPLAGIWKLFEVFSIIQDKASWKEMPYE